jgi:hypothetical protein
MNCSVQIVPLPGPWSISDVFSNLQMENSGFIVRETSEIAGVFLGLIADFPKLAETLLVAAKLLPLFLGLLPAV